MAYVVETLSVPEGRVDILLDEDPVNPREDYSHVGTIITSGAKYQIGDRNEREFDPMVECPACEGEGAIKGLGCPVCGDSGSIFLSVEQYLKKEELARVIIPLRLQAGPFLRLSPGSIGEVFEDPWENGYLCYIYDTPKAVSECLGAKATDQEIEQALLSEIEEYNTYLQGECCGYEVTAKNGKTDSCYGFLGDISYVKKEALSVLKSLQKTPSKELL